jgi:hypothetical protein
MVIQVNTGSQTPGSASLTEYIDNLIHDEFDRFADRITRVEVHLTDVNSAAKLGGDDKRCQIEVRMSGKQPISVTDHADSHELAMNGAAGKMLRLIESTLGKHDSH